MRIDWVGGPLVAAFGPTGGGEVCFLAAETAIHSAAAAGFGARAVLLDDVQPPGQTAFARDFLHLHDYDVQLGFLLWFSS